MNYLIFFISTVWVLIANPTTDKSPEQDAIFQVSTLDALKDGQYDGQVTFNELNQFGDFGLGTVDHLDGELVILNGEFFQIKSDGMAYQVDKEMSTPFAEITHFKKDFSLTVDQQYDFKGLQEFLSILLPDTLNYYAIKISGQFSQVKTRSVAAQEKPYPALAEVVKDQVVFDYPSIKGTMVGYFMPASSAGIGAPGFHFHFISKDKTKGGHVLNIQTSKVKVEIDYSTGIEVLDHKEH